MGNYRISLPIKLAHELHNYKLRIVCADVNCEEIRLFFTFYTLKKRHCTHSKHNV